MKILVTGGGGFLGLAICKELVKKYKVINFSRNHHQDLDALGITTRKGSLHNKDDILNALEDIDAVFHVAAIAGVWGKYNDYYQTNTVGTQNIVDACIDKGIKHFVYTSTPSVVFEKEDIIGGDESLPYPKKYLTHYAYTKYLAEKYVLNKTSSEFRAVSLRPHLIWGPGDPHILPRLVKRSKEGKLKQVGDGENLVDIIFVDNAAIAHVQAFEKLVENSSISGNAYFIGQEKPVLLWDFINKLLVGAGEDLIDSSVSFQTAYRVGFVLEKVFNLLGITKPEPPMTRFVATQLGKSHYFSHAKAHKDFGYVPKVTIEEGLKLTFEARNKNLSIIDLPQENAEN